MDSTIIVALIMAAATIIAQIAIAFRSNNVILYRLDKVEEKQDKHNNLIERMTKCEESTKSAHHRIDELREEI